jgi:secernin
MCDSILATQASTSDGFMLFGKNSDRQRNEAQTVEYFRGADHAQGVSVTCTYITIPQVRHTHSVLLCQPFWTWGAEMGCNEYGLAIGNEAVHARTPAAEQDGLPGMDLVRLALERATNAAEALAVITTLLQAHGQGGNCGHLEKSYYDNGFLIADPREGYVLETVGREWVVERVAGVRAISNVYSIGPRAERVSVGLHKLIRDSKWSAEAEPDYAEALTNPDREHIGHARARRRRSTGLLSASDRHLNVAQMIAILRDHGPSSPSLAGWIRDITLCMHAGGRARAGQTAGSMVAQLSQIDSVCWVTGTAAPCMSIFKPVLLNAPLPAHGNRPTDRFDPLALWWRHELLHRAVSSGDLPSLLLEVGPERDALEAKFRGRIDEVVRGGSIEDRARVVAECWREALMTEERWYSRIPQMRKNITDTDEDCRAIWTEMNRIAGMDVLLTTRILS